MDQMAGKVALITGAGSGIGRATASTFAARGVHVVVNDHDQAGGAATVDTIQAAGGSATFFAADVTNETEVAALVAYTVQTYGQINYAVNNAGVAGPEVSLLEHSNTDYTQTIDVNLKAVWLSLKYELQAMLAAGGGAIVNISSVLGLSGGVNYPIYAASKHAVIGLTKSAARSYAPHRVRINAVCPGSIRTPMWARSSGGTEADAARYAAHIPLGRIGEPTEIAEAVVWLCSPSASFVVGHALVVDGGVLT